MRRLRRRSLQRRGREQVGARPFADFAEALIGVPFAGPAYAHPLPGGLQEIQLGLALHFMAGDSKTDDLLAVFAKSKDPLWLLVKEVIETIRATPPDPLLWHGCDESPCVHDDKRRRAWELEREP